MSEPQLKAFLSMPLQDIYYICQMVDRSLDGYGFERNIEDFMGDMACARLLNAFPKFTPLHEYIEHIVTSVIWEEHNVDAEEYLDRSNGRWQKKLWVDHLLDAHGFKISFVTWASRAEDINVEEYLTHLLDQGILAQISNQAAKEAFHILFANRKVLWKFGKCAADYVKDIALSFYPDKFTSRGCLRRVAIPQWAKNAVFHRDKGICVACRADLTRLVNQQNALHHDHIIPLAQGGMNDVTNLQLLCERCNLGKSHNVVPASAVYESWYKY